MGLLVMCTELCTGTTYENGIVKSKGGKDLSHDAANASEGK